MSDTPDNPDRPSALRRWLWIMAGVVALVLVVLAGMGMYNRQQRLTPEKLQAARARWAAGGLRDYDIEVAVTGGTAGVYRVEVRNGQAVGGSVNGRPFERLDQARPWTVAELFNILEADLDRDARPDCPPVSTRVEFDPTDGHLIRYQRKQLGGAGQQVEISTLLTPKADSR